jgi:hypothetical protein
MSRASVHTGLDGDGESHLRHVFSSHPAAATVAAQAPTWGLMVVARWCGGGRRLWPLSYVV